MKNNYNSIFFLIFVSLLISLSTTAQKKIVIRGQIISTSDKQPLIGVSIAERDKTNRILNNTISDIDGNYSLPVTGKGSVITFSYVSYKTTTRTVENSEVINVAMDDGSQTFKEVTVTGRKQINTGPANIAERDLSYAVSRIDTKELEGLQVSSIDEALQGRMAGVDIVSNSGEPGAGMSIRIRGTTSINSGSDP